MIKVYVFLIGCCFFGNSICFAQKQGIIPLTGIRYLNEGVWAKSIAVKMNGNQLFGNRIPLNNEIEINLLQPSGFTTDKNKIIFAAAEYSLESTKGAILIKNPNLFLLNETKGFKAKDFQSLSIKFGIAEGIIQPNSKCIIKIRLYDLKGKNQLRLEYPVSISYPREKIPISKLIQTIPTPVGAMFIANDLKAKSLGISIDTLTSTAPKMAYLKLDIAKIAGTDIISMLQGKENFWVYDSAFNEKKITEILLKQVGGGLEGGTVNCTLKIPYRLKTDLSKGYIIRYRWESEDKTQVMDIVVSK